MKALLLLAAAVSFAPAALAQPYVVAQLGYANGDFPLGAPFNGVIDDSSPTYGVDLGIGFGHKLAAEFGYNGYGGFDGRGTPCGPGAVCSPVTVAIPSNDQTVYKLSVVRRFDVGKLRLFGKAGLYRADIHTNLEVPDSNITKTGLLLDAGVRWYLAERPWSVSVELARFDDNVSQFTVGFGWSPSPLLD